MSYGGAFYEDEERMNMYNFIAQRQGGARGAPRRFDEYYRCYPTVMLPGSERPELNYGGKIFLPPSALSKLSSLRISYPMLFELFNGQKEKLTHAGVLEFVAEEGKAYMPHWMMQTLNLETGDLVQIKSTDLPLASLVKLQPQDKSFLDISDPKAVLEKTFQQFSTLTKGDIFSFSYNDQIYDVAVLEVKPTSDKLGVCMVETDVEVDFAAPLNYVEPTSSRASGTSTPRSVGGLPAGGMLHNQGAMAQAINYDAIAPSASTAVTGQMALSSNFLLGGQKLNSKKAPTPKASTPVAGSSANGPKPVIIRRTNGPQPLRLAPNKLFFGYEIKPIKTQEDRDRENTNAIQPHFAGQGQSLSGKIKKDKVDEVMKDGSKTGTGILGRRLDGKDDKK